MVDAVRQSFDGSTRDSHSPTQAYDRQWELLVTDRSVARRPTYAEEQGRFFDAQEGLGEQRSF